MDLAALKEQLNTRVLAFAEAVKIFHARELKMAILDSPKKADAARRRYNKICENIERSVKQEMTLPRALLNYAQERAEMVRRHEAQKKKHWQLAVEHGAEDDDILTEHHELCADLDEELAECDKRIAKIHHCILAILETMGELALAYHQGDLLKIDRLTAKLAEQQKK